MILNEFENIHLLIDQAPCHVTQKVKEAFSDRNSSLLFIPKRMTNILQPADVSWMRPIKHAFQVKWNDWLINEPKSFTKSGNMKSPGYEKVINSISEIWQDFDPDPIKRSFDQCGITSNNSDQFHNQLKHFY